MPSHRGTLAVGLLAALIHSAANAETGADGNPQRLLIEQGHFWQNADKPERAAEVWNKVLLLNAGQPEALYGLGSIAVQDGNLKKAGEYLARLQALQPVPHQALQLYLALQLAQDIRLADPVNRQKLKEARLLADRGEREKTAAVYRDLLGGKPAQGLIGREYYNNLAFIEGSWPEARSGLERLMQEIPDDPYVELFLAKHLVRREDTRAEGIRKLSRLAKREDIGGDADEAWRLALTWMGTPDRSQTALFEEFLKTHPDDQDIRALLDKGRRQSSAPAVAATWKRDPGLERGLKALETGDLETAERELTARLKQAPNDADALGGLGILRQRQNRLEDAEVLLGKAARQKGAGQWSKALDEVRYWSLLQRAGDSRAAGRLGDAQLQLNEALKLKPQEPAAQLALADLQAERGSYAVAEAGYRKVLARQPGDLQARRGLISVLGQLGKQDEALRLVEALPRAEQEKLGGLGQMRAEQSLQRARLAEQRGDAAGQRAALEEALRQDPGNAWARFALARMYVDLGAEGEARSLVDGLLLSRPDDPDALYTSALLSIQLGDWKKAQDNLARIPAGARNSNINRMVDEVDFHVQLQKISELSQRGQHQEARVFLGRLQARAEGQPQRLMDLASAYAEAKDPQRALDILRDQLSRSPRPDNGLTLRYAGILLQTGQDVEVASILRDLQGRGLTSDERKQYDDLAFIYRVRQAEHLRERGELAAAYDVLAPALTQRPQDPLAVSALARMYTANGDPAKALELYRPLLGRNPDDPQLQIGAADVAMQLHENRYAEQALERALKLAPADPEILTSAARLYRQQGQSAKAAELLRKVVAQEDRQRSNAALAVSAPASAPENPFATSARPNSQRLAAAIPDPVLSAPAGKTDILTAQPSFTEDLATPTILPETRQYREPAALAPAAAQRQAASEGNPFAGSASKDARAGMSPAARALDDILQERSAYVVQGLDVRANDNESGLGKLTSVQAPLEINFPVGDDRMAVRVTPVSLNAGSVSDDAKLRYGGGAAAAIPALVDFVNNDPSGTDPDAVVDKAEGLIFGSTGRQKDSGVGLAVAWESPANGLKADLGVSPMGFLYSTAIGGASLNRPLGSAGNLHYEVGVSRRAVTDSLLSFAGAKDARTGLKWGGVTANGGRAELGYDDGEVGAYGYAAAHALRGEHVKSNTRAELGSGIYWYLLNDDSRLFTAGLGLTAIGYENNQNNFTYGNGGYFSPQQFLSLAVPVKWSQRGDKWTYSLQGSIGVQHIEQDAEPYFPNDKDMQRALEQISAAATDLGASIPTRFSGSNDTGIGYSLAGAAEYQLGRNFFAGGHLGINNSQDYREWNGGMYLRYMFEDQYRPQALPVSPYRSPYTN